MKTVITISLFIYYSIVYAQKDDSKSKLSFTGDFRFRIEQDWDSKKSSGEYRADRSRARYRFRGGFEYKVNEFNSFGSRIRTGNPSKQQDPHLTLGEGFKEFGTLPIALEKAYFKHKSEKIAFWLGKNSFPFEKQNELFWCDNVYPEGVFIQKTIISDKGLLNKLEINSGHFILNTRGKSFDEDSYFQGAQINSLLFNNRLKIFPSLYVFRNIQNIPDGLDTYLFDYTIFNIGSSIKISKTPLIQVEMDFYKNLKDYSKIDSIPMSLKNETIGIVAALAYGKLKTENDIQLKISYAYIEKYAAVDFLAQNDWARWSYSSVGSPDSRLTNFNGIEIVLGYMVTKNMSLNTKFYLVEQIIPLGLEKETGKRIRLDLDIKI